LVDPEALGIRMPASDASCPVDTVLLLDAGDTRDDMASGRARSMEIALAEHDEALLDEIRSTPGIAGLRPAAPRPFPVFVFDVGAGARPMAAMADLARRHRDLVLYIDEARDGRPSHPVEPVLREARW